MKQASLLEQKNVKETPHYKGHRDRLRKRFINGGTDALADYELLELILFMAIPRKDVKPLAKKLIDKFGSFAGVLNAPMNELINFDGLSEISAITLKSVQSSAHKMLKQEYKNKPVFSNPDALSQYLMATMAHEKKEHFRILFLNKKNELIEDEIQQSGTVDHTPAYPREIVKRALELSATAMILVHNHPSGDSSPSDADIKMTHNIIDAARTLNIVIHDHIIVSKYGHSSMRELGLI